MYKKTNMQITEVNCPRQFAQMVGNQAKAQISYTGVFCLLVCWPAFNRFAVKLITDFNGGNVKQWVRVTLDGLQIHCQGNPLFSSLGQQAHLLLGMGVYVGPASYKPRTQRINPSGLGLVTWAFWGLHHSIWSEGKEERDQNSNPVQGSTSI